MTTKRTHAEFSDDDDYEDKSLKKKSQNRDVDVEVFLVEPEVDLKVWKLGMMTDAALRLQKKNNEQKTIDRAALKPYINEILHFSSLNEINDNYKIIKPWPSDENWMVFEKYVIAEGGIKDRFVKRIKCPWPLCKHSNKRKSKLRLHYLTHRPECRRFGCICGSEFFDKKNLETHIDKIHKGIVHTCDVCNAEFCSTAAVNQHQSHGHVNPVGEEVFFSPKFRTIKRKIYDVNDIKSQGTTYQLICMPWYNSNDEIEEVSIEMTSFGDFELFASTYKQNLENFIREFDASLVGPSDDNSTNPSTSSTGSDPSDGDDSDDNSTNPSTSSAGNDRPDDADWIQFCGHARILFRRGLHLVPKNVFPLNLYGIGEKTCGNLKWWVREYVDAFRIFSPHEAKVFLANYSQDLKTHLEPYILKMGFKNQAFVREYGAEF